VLPLAADFRRLILSFHSQLHQSQCVEPSICSGRRPTPFARTWPLTKGANISSNQLESRNSPMNP
jgi:hypothetical protein